MPYLGLEENEGAMGQSKLDQIRNQLKHIDTGDWRLTGVRIEHNGTKANIEAIDDFHRAAPKYVRFLLDEIDRLHDQYAHEGGIPQLMPLDTVKRWLIKANHLPSVEYLHEGSVPNTFEVKFKTPLEQFEKDILNAYGFDVIWGEVNLKSAYLLKWRTPRNDEY